MSAESRQSKFPIVLIDQPDDGTCEEWGWVEATVSADEAQRLISEFEVEHEGYALRLPVKEPTCFLRLDDPDIDYEYQRWYPCEPTADGARKFWRFEVIDKDDGSETKARRAM